MLHDTIITHLRSASRELVRELGILNNRYAEIGSISQCHALIELNAHGVLTLGDLSNILNLDKSSTSRLISQLCERGICQFWLDVNDRRNKLISLTKKGLELVTVIHSNTTSQIKNALNMMSESEQTTAMQGLSLYVKALKQARLQNEYKIRKLTKTDVPQLIRLIRSVWVEFGFDSSHAAADIYEEELHQMYETYAIDKSNYFVLVNDNKIVGGVGYTPLVGEKNIGEIKGMYLSAELRGLGLGTFLFKKILHEVQKDGFKQCYLETMDFMRGANHLYQKFGFQKLDKPLGKTGHSWTNCWYIKELGETFNSK
jgi:putative acetyltransferase